jgi:hypothetical protein
MCPQEYQSHVRIESYDYVCRVVEKSGRCRLLVQIDKGFFIKPGEVISIEMGEISIEVPETDRPLKLDFFSAPTGFPARIVPTEICYRLVKNNFRTGWYTGLLSPGPALEKGDQTGEAVSEFEMPPPPKKGDRYAIEISTLYVFSDWNEGYNRLEWLPGYSPNIAPFCYFTKNWDVLDLGFSFLNDKGEWEPFRDFNHLEYS